MSGQQRVLQLLPTLSQGGAELYVYRLAKLQMSGEFVPLVCAMMAGGPVAEQLRAAGVPTEVLGIERPSVRRPWQAWRAWQRLYREVKELAQRHQVSLIQTHLSDSDWVGLRVGRALGVPVILTFHSSKLIPPNRKPGEIRARARRLLQALFYRRAQALIAVGSSVQEQLLRFPGVRPERVHLVPSAIEIPPVPSAAELARWRERHAELFGGGPVLISVGRLVPSKAHERLIQVMPAIARRHPGVRLWIAGDGPERARLEQLARDSGAAPWVRLLGARPDVQQLLPLADLYLTGTRREGLGLAAAEGMAAGLPVVGFRVSGIEDVVEEGRTGLLVGDGDLEAFALQVLRLLDDPAERAAMGAAARLSAQRYDIREARARTEEIYRQVLAQG